MIPVVGTIMIVALLAFGIGIIISLPSVNLFNEEFNTNYTATQWLFSSDTIQNYIHKNGKMSTVNLNLKGE